MGSYSNLNPWRYVALKIAVLTSSYPRYTEDGVNPFIHGISLRLLRAGNDVEVVAPYDPACRPWDTQGIRLHRFRYIWPERYHIMGHGRSLENDNHLRLLAYLLLPFFLLSACITLWRVTGRQKSDVIYAHWVVPNGLAAAWVARLRGIPFILSLHGSDVYVSKRSKAIGRVARWVFSQAAAVTACSAEMRTTAIALGASPDTRLVAWGADPAIYTPARRKPAPDGAERKLQIATLGRFVPKKGFENLLAVMPAVLQHRADAHLTIGGDGTLMEPYRRLIDQLGIAGNVSLPGTIPWLQVADFMAQADIFVQPSIRDPNGNVDGLPSTLLEAMASGCAVIASDVGGVSLVVHHGENGLVVPPGDIPALEAALLELALDEPRRQRLAQAARQSVVETYNWDHVIAEVSALLEAAVAGNRRRREQTV